MHLAEQHLSLSLFKIFKYHQRIGLRFKKDFLKFMAVVLQQLNNVQFFATLWTAIRQASLPFTFSWSLLKLLAIESVMLLNHRILCYPLLLLPTIFPSIRVFANQFFISGGQGIGASASASVLPINIQPDFLQSLHHVFNYISVNFIRTM